MHKLKYITTNEVEHFDFAEAYIVQMQQMNGYFYMDLDNVTILPENSCNRDIRKMRANQFSFKIPDGQICELVEEGFKVYDADGNLSRQQEDVVIEPKDYNEVLKGFTECYIYSLEKKDSTYQISIDGEDHTYLIRINGTKDVEEWDRFLNLGVVN